MQIQGGAGGTASVSYNSLQRYHVTHVIGGSGGDAILSEDGAFGKPGSSGDIRVYQPLSARSVR